MACASTHSLLEDGSSPGGGLGVLRHNVQLLASHNLTRFNRRLTHRDHKLIVGVTAMHVAVAF